jgi:hypothetical protein
MPGWTYNQSASVWPVLSGFDYTSLENCQWTALKVEVYTIFFGLFFQATTGESVDSSGNAAETYVGTGGSPQLATADLSSNLTTASRATLGVSSITTIGNFYLYFWKLEDGTPGSTVTWSSQPFITEPPTPCTIFTAPCFSLQTLHKIFNIPYLSKQKLYLMTKTVRNDKKMYRCNYGNFGTLEFTADHPFLFKNKLYSFEELIKVHPILKKSAQEISLDDAENGKESFIYNFYGHYEQTHKNNQFEIGPNLIMLGGKITDKKEDYDRVKEKMDIIEKNRDYEKYSLEKFLEKNDINSNELYIVSVTSGKKQS